MEKDKYVQTSSLPSTSSMTPTPKTSNRKRGALHNSSIVLLNEPQQPQQQQQQPNTGLVSTSTLSCTNTSQSFSLPPFLLTTIGGDNGAKKAIQNEGILSNMIVSYAFPVIATVSILAIACRAVALDYYTWSLHELIEYQLVLTNYSSSDMNDSNDHYTLLQQKEYNYEELLQLQQEGMSCAVRNIGVFLYPLATAIIFLFLPILTLFSSSRNNTNTSTTLLMSTTTTSVTRILSWTTTNVSYAFQRVWIVIRSSSRTVQREATSTITATITTTTSNKDKKVSFQRSNSGTTGVNGGADHGRASESASSTNVGINDNKNKDHGWKRGQQQQQPQHPLSNAETPFLTLNDTARLSLSDMEQLYRYAIAMNIENKQDESHTPSARPRRRETVRVAIEAIKKAIRAARTEGVELSSPTRKKNQSPLVDDKTLGGNNLDNVDVADMDALAFAAVVRIHVEWGQLRMVPKGSYPLYASAMVLVKKDMLNNIRKMEDAVHAWITAKRQEQQRSTRTNAKSGTGSSGSAVIRSPTLRELIQHEIDTGKHVRLPHLTDNSAAAAVLWIKRQLDYQRHILANLAQIPLVFPNGKEANYAAYRAVYDCCHGFLMKQVFLRTIEAAPDAESILDHMNPNRLVKEESCCTDVSTDDDDEDDDWARGLGDVEVQTSTTTTTTVAVAHRQQDEDNPLVQFGSMIVNEWDKLGAFFGQCHHHQQQQHNHHHHHKVEQGFGNGIIPDDNPIVQFGFKIMTEWDKLGSMFSQCIGFDEEHHPARHDVDVVKDEYDDENESVCNETIHTSNPLLITPGAPQDDLRRFKAITEIPSFLSVLQPMVVQLNHMITAFNIDDPKKA